MSNDLEISPFLESRDFRDEKCANYTLAQYKR
jgi:hypothetical protein